MIPFLTCAGRETRVLGVGHNLYGNIDYNANHSKLKLVKQQKSAQPTVQLSALRW